MTREQDGVRMSIYENLETNLNDRYISKPRMSSRLHRPSFNANVHWQMVSYPNDLTKAMEINNAGSITPTRKERPTFDTGRKQMLLSLLDALTELQKESENNTSSSNTPPDVVKEELQETTITSHEQRQKAGAETFQKFQKRISDLDRVLRSFTNAARQLGSSVGILSSAFHLRERLAYVLFLFRENAADLFPRNIQRQSVVAFLDQRIQTHESSARKRRRSKHKALSHSVSPDILENPDVEDFPYQLEGLAKDLTIFLDQLNELTDYADALESLNTAIFDFETDAMYWASCLKRYKGQFKFPAVQRYLHDLSVEMMDHLETTASSLSLYIEIGIPTIRYAQKHAAQHLLTLTTAATFFSAVTATTLQYSFNEVGKHLPRAVNALWFVALVLSISSTVNSLLGLIWKQSVYHSSAQRIPKWVLIWMKRSPSVFLVLSFLDFSAGLCLFAFSSGQSLATSAVTTVLTFFSFFGIVAVYGWSTYARRTPTSSRYRGEKLIRCHACRSPIVSVKSLRRVLRTTNSQIMRVGMGIYVASRRMSNALLPRSRIQDTAAHANGREEYAHPGGTPSEPLSSPVSPGVASPSADRINDRNDRDTLSPLPSSLSAASLNGSPSVAASSELQTTLSGKARLQGIIRNLIRTRALIGPNSPIASGAEAQPRQRSVSSTIIGSESGTREEQLASTTRVSRVTSLIPTLECLQPTMLLTPHTALVRHLQFSPNGEYLATCSWDRTCLIFRVKDFSRPHRVLAHPQSFVSQVAWSPTGDLLLTKMVRGMKIWTTDGGMCQKIIDRQCSVQAVAWFPQGEAFLSVEGSNVTKLDINGKVIDTYEFDRMVLHDVAITQDQQLMLCVATTTASPDGLKPSMSREEKQIIVYNLEKKEIESQVPVLHEVRHITLAKDGIVALVSYENKAPPQLWKLELLKARINETGDTTARLSLVHTYMPRTMVEFAGPSYFGGYNDQLVICAGKAGDIHIWDRGSAFLINSINAQNLDGDMTCIAWNHAASHHAPASPHMFATGSHNGAIRIWTAPETVLSRTPSSYPYTLGAYTPSHTAPHISIKVSETDGPGDVSLGSSSYTPVHDGDNPTGRGNGGLMTSPDGRKVAFADDTILAE